MKLPLAILVLFLTGCTVTIPLGQEARYGVVGLSMSYLPPINILAEQPNLGGYRK
jgi:hypothetical protein